ncbi:MAG: HAD-IB family hydrolase [Bacteroidetes bacterium]|nr:MAG: HAD-IB family hydrolase [Bacteroidota bacterium]
MKRRIAFLDFDGTITTRDTLLEIIKYQKGVFRFYLGFLLCSPVLVALKLKLISNQTAKEVVLRYFFRNESLTEFQQKCDSFAGTELKKLIRPKALIEINRLRSIGADIVIVSASASNWIRPWSDPLEIYLITTVLENRNGLLTGRIEGKNCHGKEKVSRIRSQFDLASYDEIYCYGDSRGDKPMLSLATTAFYKPFR